MAKARFEKGALRRAERAAARAENLRHTRRCRAATHLSASLLPADRAGLVILATGALPADQRWRSGAGKLIVAHAHHPVGDAVCIVFQRIVDAPNFELRLQDARPGRNRGSYPRADCLVRRK